MAGACALALGVGLTSLVRRPLAWDHPWHRDWLALAEEPEVEAGHRFRYARVDAAGRGEVTLECLDAGRGQLELGTFREPDALAARVHLVARPGLGRLPPLEPDLVPPGASREDDEKVGDDLEVVRVPAGTFRCGRVRLVRVEREAGYVRIDAWWSPTLSAPVRIWRRPGQGAPDARPPSADDRLGPGELLWELAASEPGPARAPDEVQDLLRELEARERERRRGS